MNDLNEPWHECYFRRQPQTQEEVDHAIEAMCVSDMAALRYGGTDPTILRRLIEAGLRDECDYPDGAAELTE